MRASTGDFNATIGVSLAFWLDGAAVASSQSIGALEDVARRGREVAERLVELAETVAGDAADGDLNRAVTLVAGAGACALFANEARGGDVRGAVASDFYLESAREYEAAAHKLIRDAVDVFADDQEVTRRWLDAAA